jgi:hypothetical protein
MSSIVADPIRSGVFYAGADAMYRSTDRGATWELASSGYESRFPPGPFGVSARTGRVYVSSAQLQSVPFVMNVASSAPYSRSWATYLENGTVIDVANTPSGLTAVALTTAVGDLQSEAYIVLIGR